MRHTHHPEAMKAVAHANPNGASPYQILSALRAAGFRLVKGPEIEWDPPEDSERWVAALEDRHGLYGLDQTFDRRIKVTIDDRVLDLSHKITTHELSRGDGKLQEWFEQKQEESVARALWDELKNAD